MRKKKWEFVVVVVVEAPSWRGHLRTQAGNDIHTCLVTHSLRQNTQRHILRFLCAFWRRSSSNDAAHTHIHDERYWSKNENPHKARSVFAVHRHCDALVFPFRSAKLRQHQQPTPKAVSFLMHISSMLYNVLCGPWYPDPDYIQLDARMWRIIIRINSHKETERQSRREKRGEEARGSMAVCHTYKAILLTATSIHYWCVRIHREEWNNSAPSPMRQCGTAATAAVTTHISRSTSTTVDDRIHNYNLITYSGARPPARLPLCNNHFRTETAKTQPAKNRSMRQRHGEIHALFDSVQAHAVNRSIHERNCRRRSRKNHRKICAIAPSGYSISIRLCVPCTSVAVPVPSLRIISCAF